MKEIVDFVRQMQKSAEEGQLYSFADSCRHLLAMLEGAPSEVNVLPLLDLKPGEWFKVHAPTLTDMVREFHAAFRLPGDPGQPTLCDSLGRRELRRKLLEEEYKEYLLGEDTNDICEIADALGDMAYIIWGTALEYGIPLDRIIAEIHRSNMSKLDEKGEPIMRADGKVLKSARYTPPDIAGILNGKA